MFLDFKYECNEIFKTSFVKAFMILLLSVERVEADTLPVCEGDCEAYNAPQAEYLAHEVIWNLDLAIEAQPIYSQDPQQIFSELFHVVNRTGKSIAGLTETLVDLSSMHWSARLECERKPANTARRCFVMSEDSEDFELVDIITGLITGTDQPAREPRPAVSASTSMFFRGKAVVKPSAQVRVLVGWPTIGVQNLPVEWRKPITEAIFMILGHEKLHVDNFLQHLPQVAEIVLHPPVTSFEVLPGEEPFEKLDVAARAAAVQQINKMLYDPQYSDCKRMNCIYDGKGSDCSKESEHLPKRLAAQWEAPQEWNPDGWDSLKLGMFIDQGSHYPGLKSPGDFKAPNKQFEFRWTQQASR